ncbi:hypothetical protein [Urechidicola croceus]|uniref:Uncharacterized protein n=1 Tax=Urechidicola croceus TaxID=1850246 RepID=A0A1D8PBC4_9FLAO|nr:hypothetical protein [Urechidicola croceus]AOW21856.1 hypothetical protein LPB138_14695 [Urechidicola croceus]
MKYNKIIGVIFSIFSIVYSINFIVNSKLTYRLESYFDIEYLMSFSPVIVSIILLIAGILLFINPAKANLALALFGHSVVEEILFNWLGISDSYYDLYLTIIFLIFGLTAIFIAYTDTFSSKKLSIKQAIISFIIGTLFAIY